MKKIALLLLALAGGLAPLCAQTEVPTPYSNPWFPAKSNRTEELFNTPAPGTLRHQFTFGLGNRNSMRIELTYPGQLKQINDLDSLFRAVWDGLRPFADSLSKPLVSRRVDYRIGGPADVQLRILEHPQQGDVYRIRNNDTSQVKVEQDTLRIVQYTADSSMWNRRVMVNGHYVANYQPQPYVIILVLNNIGDAAHLSPADLFWAVTHLKEEMGKNIDAPMKTQYLGRFSAAYDVPARRKVSFGQTAYRFGLSLAPYVQVGVQYARGAWLPSAGAGIEFSLRKSERSISYYRLIWEPHFTFGRNPDGKATTEINHFVTFRYAVNITGNNSRELRFAQNFSLGYLRRRGGETFEKNTFKFTLPGLQTKNVLLEPEFFFNDLFKNFSPSLKLTLALD